jgi:Flp pilus assembly protein TadG
MTKNFAAVLRRFSSDVKGNVAIMTGIAAVPLLAAAGSAVDYVRWQDAHSDLTVAMDTAVLAGTQALYENGGKEEAALAVAADYFKVSVGSMEDILVNNIKFKINQKGNGVAAYGEAKLKTVVLNIVGLSELPLVSPTEAEIAVAENAPGSPGGDLEISLMLDVTGSMCDDNTGPCTSGAKMDALKDAATRLVDTVVWDDQSKYTSKVAVVPFSTRVRVGPDGGGGAMMKKLTNLDATWSGYYKMCVDGYGSGGSEDGGNWTCNKYQTQYYSNWKIMPCVTDRFYDATWAFGFTDDKPGSGAYLNGHDGTRMTLGTDSSATSAKTKLGKKKSDPAENWNYESGGICYDVAQADEVMPLTNSKSSLKGKINGLEAYGATAGVLGTSFSWYMLSPNWNSVWTGTSVPQPYSKLKEKNDTGAPKLRKIAILMTDGAYNTYRGWKDASVADMGAAAKSMCAAMKAKGIEIFTVGFDLDGLPSSEKSTAIDTLQSCGTDIEHFYNSLNVDQLQAAFDEIGKKVSMTSTRLTK